MPPVNIMQAGSGTGRASPTGWHAEPFFDPWLSLTQQPTGPHSLVALALASIAGIETRTRRRQPDALTSHEALVTVIMANLVRSVLTVDAPHPVPVTLAKRRTALTRYDRRGLSLLSETLGALAKAGLVEIAKSDVDGRASTFWPSTGLVDAVMARADLGDLRRDDAEERIVLRRTVRDDRDRVVARQVFDYRDTPETLRFREEVDTINVGLEQADLAFLGDEPGVNTYQRRLRRIFHLPPGYPEDQPRFDMGGRLYDGWWINLPKAQRRHIKIDGEPVAELDFSGMFLRLAYLNAGHEPPPGDLYRTLAGVQTGEHRTACKKVVNALLFRDGLLVRLPKDTREGLPPALRSARVFREAFLAAHPKLAGSIERGLGFRLMRTESDIMVAVLLRLREAGVTALPIHDGVLVAGSRAVIAGEVMGEASRATAGAALRVAHKFTPIA